ncbi:ATP synthase subunit ATP5MJ, mitochondrial [Mauremys mutica]|uniref:ATP synthase subunit ATP5MJ, mitochondrial n=1 Tax=Mauremys mutica TaxID=74926 RepID=UPI001D160C4F|nr:ATP synthase subunit ATP5MJ, mitochondrial [Mauremys mutica]
MDNPPLRGPLLPHLVGHQPHPFLPASKPTSPASQASRAWRQRQFHSVTFANGPCVTGSKMLKYFTKTWRHMKIYYTTVYQEIWVGLALTSYVYYKLSFGRKKAVADKSSSGHH